MKCIKCGQDNKLKERTANHGHCMSCQHPFVFDPKADQSSEMNFTDAFFQHFLDAATAQGSLQVTRQQLFYVFNARYLRRQTNWFNVLGVLLLLAGLPMIFLGGSVSAIFFVFWVLCWACALICLIPAWRERWFPPAPKPAPISQSQFTLWLERWNKANGATKQLLPPPQKQAPIRVKEEVTKYSFDRVVVCQRDTLAQFLIANHFHFEHNCAVLSISGYPHNLFDTVMEMLRRNPDLKVYALHDASAEGVQMPRRLLTEKQWFKDFPNVQIFDLGLMPRQVMQRPLLLSEKGSRPAEVIVLTGALKENLQPAELDWLRQGNVVELEAIHPQRLLQMLALGIAKSRDPNATDTYVAVDSGSGDGALYVYSSDSFG